MTHRKSLWFALLPALVFVAACNRGQVQDPAPVETTETPSPTPSPTPATFELEGVVLEASGSAQAAGDGSPSPGATGRSPSPATPDAEATTDATTSPDSTDQATPGEAPLFRNASPGSIALRLNSFTGAGPCTFNTNDTIVASFTGNTTFEPAEVTEVERFPNNLIRATLRVTGDIVEPEEGCVLLARSITVTQASPSPTARARTTATRSPTPRAATARRTPTPSPTPSPTPAPTVNGSPGSPGSPGA